MHPTHRDRRSVDSTRPRGRPPFSGDCCTPAITRSRYVRAHKKAGVLAWASSSRNRPSRFPSGQKNDFGLFPYSGGTTEDSHLFPYYPAEKNKQAPFCVRGKQFPPEFLCCLYYKTQRVRLSIAVGRLCYDSPKNIQISPRLFGQVAPAHRACGARAYPRRTGRVCGARRRRSAWPAGPAAPVSKSLRSGRRPRACRPR